MHFLNPERRVNKKRAAPFGTTLFFCGGKGIRTPGLLHAMQALYQLSYTPNLSGCKYTGGIWISPNIFCKNIL